MSDDTRRRKGDAYSESDAPLNWRIAVASPGLLLPRPRLPCTTWQRCAFRMKRREYLARCDCSCTSPLCGRSITLGHQTCTLKAQLGGHRKCDKAIYSTVHHVYALLTQASCIICMERAAVRCGHFVLCRECAAQNTGSSSDDDCCRDCGKHLGEKPPPGGVSLPSPSRSLPIPSRERPSATGTDMPQPSTSSLRSNASAEGRQPPPPSARASRRNVPRQVTFSADVEDTKEPGSVLEFGDVLRDITSGKSFVVASRDHTPLGTRHFPAAPDGACKLKRNQI